MKTFLKVNYFQNIIAIILFKFIAEEDENPEMYQKMKKLKEQDEELEIYAKMAKDLNQKAKGNHDELYKDENLKEKDSVDASNS